MELPVVVIIKAPECPWCKTLENNMPILRKQLADKSLNVRFKEMSVNNIHNGSLDVNSFPAGLNAFCKFFYPILLLIPGKEWDSAMAAGLGPNNKHDFTKTASIFDARYDNVKKAVVQDRKYREMYSGGFADWVAATLALPAFRGDNAALVATIPSAAPIPNFPPLFSVEKSDSKTPKNFSEVCSLRLIPRSR